MSKAGKLRRKRIDEDVKRYVRYAAYSGNHDNPFALDDKRHALFAKSLARSLSFVADFTDQNNVFGVDMSIYKRRSYPNPGPVRPLSEF